MGQTETRKGIHLDGDTAEITGSDADFKKALTSGDLDEVLQLTIGGKVTIIPNELGRLVSLEHLSLEKCKVRALPDALFKLVALQTLSANSVKMESLPSPGWARLKKLAELLLPSGLVELPEDLGEANIGGELDLRHTRLKVLPESVGRMAKVRGLLCPPGLHTLPRSMGSMKSLQAMTLGKVRALPADLGSLKKLERLWIAEGAPLKEIPETIGACSSLARLEVRGASLSALPESLADCPLKHLSLTRMDAITALPARLGANGKLETLVLGLGLTSLPVSLLSSKNLRRVVLPKALESKLRTSSTKLLKALGEAVTFE